MLDPKEIDVEIARLEYGESSYPAYAKLATLYTIRNQMNRTDESLHYKTSYSSSPEPASSSVDDYGDSEFLQSLYGKNESDVWAIMDDLMDTLQVANPRVYNGVMRKIRSL